MTFLLMRDNHLNVVLSDCVPGDPQAGTLNDVIYEEMEIRADNYPNVYTLDYKDLSSLASVSDSECYITVDEGSDAFKLKLPNSGFIILCLRFCDKFNAEQNEIYGNIIQFTEDISNKIKAVCKVDDLQFKKCISFLKKKKLLLMDRGDKSKYYLNPYFYFKGDFRDRKIAKIAWSEVV